MKNDSKCIFCECHNVLISSKDSRGYQRYVCSVCGTFIAKDTLEKERAAFSDKIISYLYYQRIMDAKNDNNKIYFIGNEDVYNTIYSNDDDIIFLADNKIIDDYPTSLSNRLKRILFGFADRSTYVGEVISFSQEELNGALFVTRFDKDENHIHYSSISTQCCTILDYLQHEEYIKYTNNMSDIYYIMLTPIGWMHVMELGYKKSS